MWDSKKAVKQRKKNAESRNEREAHTCRDWRRAKTRGRKRWMGHRSEPSNGRARRKTKVAKESRSPWEIDRNDKNFKRKFIKYFLHIRIKAPAQTHTFYIRHWNFAWEHSSSSISQVKQDRFFSLLFSTSPFRFVFIGSLFLFLCQHNKTLHIRHRSCSLPIRSHHWWHRALTHASITKWWLFCVHEWERVRHTIRIFHNMIFMLIENA